MKKTGCLHIVLLLLLLPLLSFSQNYSEYAIKAVLIEKITRFVEWPKDSKVNNDNTPFVISIIGENPFNNILENIYSYQTINDKKVQIRYIESIKKISDTDLLFISSSKADVLEKILEYTSKKSILTFGDTKGYANKGVHINFYIKNNKVRFEINETNVRDSNLYISFRLLSQAVIVNPLINNYD